MAYEQRDNSGKMFKNVEKNQEGGNPRWPDYKGNIMVAGVDYWLSCWVKDGKKGKFLSVAVQAKDERQEGRRAAPTAAAPVADDNMPF
jgi:hypothetical protein